MTAYRNDIEATNVYGKKVMLDENRYYIVCDMFVSEAPEGKRWLATTWEDDGDFWGASREEAIREAGGNIRYVGEAIPYADAVKAHDEAEAEFWAEIDGK